MGRTGQGKHQSTPCVHHTPPTDRYHTSLIAAHKVGIIIRPTLQMRNRGSKRGSPEGLLSSDWERPSEGHLSPSSSISEWEPQPYGVAWTGPLPPGGEGGSACLWLLRAARSGPSRWNSFHAAHLGGVSPSVVLVKPWRLAGSASPLLWLLFGLGASDSVQD